jgi:uncharacterized protein YcbK (DUF882 family)
MITAEELNPNGYAVTEEQKANLSILLERVNVIRNEWGKAMTVTSGLRTVDDMKRIYQAIAQRKGLKGPVRIPMGSQHMKGAAVDIYDPDLLLTAWLKENNSQRLIDAKLWCEEGNSNWVHFQIVPPGSGNRWFKP